MAISRLVASNSLAALCVAYVGRRTLPLWLLLPLLQTGTGGLVVALCSHPAVNCVGLLGKSEAGNLQWWSYLLFYPYLALAQGYVYAMRRRRRRRKKKSGDDEPVYSEVSEGIFVGGWPFEPEHVPDGSPAVVDCTCELPRSSCLDGLPYLCVPTWDSRRPEAARLARAAAWAARMRRLGRPVLVHCAFGHGRSVVVACALLISLGIASSPEAAREIIQRKRPRIHMSSSQMSALQEWWSSERSRM